MNSTKTILITGSTDGIGKLAALDLAKKGHHIYLHGRNQEKLNATIEELASVTKNRNIQGFLTDFSDLESVRNMAKEVSEKLPKLDVLINNAGVYASSNSETKSGVDIRFVVNYFAPYLLTNELLPLLDKGTMPRIINLSSAAQAPVSLSALEGKEQLTEREAYAQSKLALIMWSFDLAKNQPEMEVIPVNPGSLLDTKMVAEAFGEHWSPADKGANILVDLSLSDEYLGKSGQYFDNAKGEEKGFFAPAHPDSLDTSKIKDLLEVTERIV